VESSGLSEIITMPALRNFACLAVVMLAAGCQRAESQTVEKRVMPAEQSSAAQSSAGSKDAKLAKITLGSGCFWCTEAFFQRLKGVTSVVSGYSGGKVENPTYEAVCSGSTGHAEVIQVTYDPAQISFEDLLKVFWQTHDPTTPNQQGHDVGTQYRSAIFYHTEDQRRIAEQYKKQLEASRAFKAPIVTEITAFTNFYPAEKYHQNYFNANPSQSYCQFVIRPKIEKFNKEFKDKLKEGTEAR
jgi:methionine-S-sulfoxide reductase